MPVVCPTVEANSEGTGMNEDNTGENAMTVPMEDTTVPEGQVATDDPYRTYPDPFISCAQQSHTYDEETGAWWQEKGKYDTLSEAEEI